MYIIMLLYRQSHIMSKLHVYCTHKDTKQYLFGLFTLYTCTMYFGERFFNFAFLLHFQTLGTGIK